MNIYFSGIGGVGIGALAEIAHSAGYGVCGSDMQPSPLSKNLENLGIEIHYGNQNGDFLEQKFIKNNIEMFVYTAALPSDHPELLKAKELGLKIAKRDELLNQIIEEKNLKLIAVSGTHGKTTTTGMLIWTFKQLKIPVSWSVGATLSFGKSGFFDPESHFFIYEADEFDRNFLHFSPFISLITSIDHDHTDIYKTEQEYFEAFADFAKQSDFTITWKDQHSEIFEKINNKAILKYADKNLKLLGEHNRKNATLVLEALDFIASNDKTFCEDYHQKSLQALNNFPGTDRRFEKITDGIYSDYGHHPVEIRSTLELAKELVDKNGFSGISLIYQPHQNVRQHEVKNDYTPEIFNDANEILWLPTFLSRENPNLAIISPEELSQKVSDKTQIFEMTNQLINKIEELQKNNRLILAMSAGSLDGFIRENFKQDI